MSTKNSDSSLNSKNEDTPYIISVAKFKAVCVCALEDWGVCDTHRDLSSRIAAHKASTDSTPFELLEIPPIRFLYHKSYPLENYTIYHLYLPSDDDIQSEVTEAARIIELLLPSAQVLFFPPFLASCDGFRKMQIRFKSGTLTQTISTMWNKAKNDHTQPTKKITDLNDDDVRSESESSDITTSTEPDHATT